MPIFNSRGFNGISGMPGTPGAPSNSPTMPGQQFGVRPGPLTGGMNGGSMFKAAPMTGLTPVKGNVNPSKFNNQDPDHDGDNDLLAYEDADMDNDQMMARKRQIMQGQGGMGRSRMYDTY